MISAQVLESTRVWSHPRESYDALARQLRLNFTIRLVPNTRTRPVEQDHPKCPPSEVERFKRLVSDCDLKMRLPRADIKGVFFAGLSGRGDAV